MAVASWTDRRSRPSCLAGTCGCLPTVKSRLGTASINTVQDRTRLLHLTRSNISTARTSIAADLFNNGDYTRVDLRGGSLDGMIEAYRKLLPTLDGRVQVVPGRGRVGSKSDLEDYLAVMIALRDRITKLIRDGRTVEEAVALKPTADFDAKWANGPVRPNQIVEEIYADLKRTI